MERKYLTEMCSIYSFTLNWSLFYHSKYLNWTVVVVKWSPSTPIIQVRILLESTVFFAKFVFEKEGNKNEALPTSHAK